MISGKPSKHAKNYKSNRFLRLWNATALIWLLRNAKERNIQCMHAFHYCFSTPAAWLLKAAVERQLLMPPTALSTFPLEGKGLRISWSSSAL